MGSKKLAANIKHANFRRGVSEIWTALYMMGKKPLLANHVFQNFEWNCYLFDCYPEAPAEILEGGREQASSITYKVK